jgi:DNA-binding transcriptional MerR regulator
VGVDTHVLRYWESEFAIIKPFRGKSKQRLYRRQDVENLLRIKGLLHDEGYTISGARKFLKSIYHQDTIQPEKVIVSKIPEDVEMVLLLIKKELHAILEQLGKVKEKGDK